MNPKLNVDIPASILVELEDVLNKLWFNAGDDMMRDWIKSVEHDLSDKFRDAELLTRATTLAENQYITVLEHPDMGDETCVMVWDNNRRNLFRWTPFYDADLDEIEGWLKDIYAKW